MAAISYYALGLIKIVLEGVSHLWPALQPSVATAVAAPFVVLIVWRSLHRVRARIMQDHDTPA